MRRLYLVNKSGERQRCYNTGDLPEKHKPRFALYKCLECGWLMCRECAVEHFRDYHTRIKLNGVWYVRERR